MRGSPRQTWLVVRRELRLELAGTEAALVALPYGLMVLILVGLGLDGSTAPTEAFAPTATWIIVLTTAAPLARLVAAVEHDDRTWDLLRGLVRPLPLIAGKVAALWVALLLTWLVAAVLSVALLGSALRPVAVLASALGTLGLALNTAAFGVLLGHSGRRTGLLAALLLPCGIPILLAGTRIGDGAPPAPWLTLLTVYDAVLLAVVWAVTPLLLEE